MKKELLAIKTKEQLNFAESRRRINELFPNMKTTYATAVRTTTVTIKWHVIHSYVRYRKVIKKT